MKRQADKSSVRHSKRSKDSISSRRNYRTHDSSRELREARDDKYTSRRQKLSSPQDTASPTDRHRESKRENRDRKTEKTYRTLAVENFSSQISNEDIEESLYFEYRKFGDVSVRVVEAHGNRIAYVTFKYPECAIDAKNAKGTLVMHDRRLIVDVIYERKTPGSSNEKKYDSEHHDRKHKDVSDSRDRRERRSRSVTPVRSRRSPSPVKTSRYETERSYSKRSSPRYEDISQPPRKSDFDDDSRYSLLSPENGRSLDTDLLPEDDKFATRTLFVGNFEGYINSGSIRRAFENYGKVDDVDIKQGPRGQGGYAFVRFENLDDAYKAKGSMHGRTLLDAVIRVGYGKPVISSKLWVGGLGSWISLGTLEREFDRFGSIRKIDYERGADHAHVLFESLDAAREACTQMRGATMPGSDIRLRLDFADPVPGLPGWEDWEGQRIEREREERSRDRNDRFNNDRRYSRGGRGRNGYDNRGGRYDRKFRDDRFNNRGRGGRDGFNRRRSISPFNRNGDAFNPPEIDEQLLFKQAQAKCVIDLHQLCEVFNPPVWDGSIVVKKTAFAIRFFALDGDINVMYDLITHNTPDNNADMGTFLNMNQKVKLSEETKMSLIRKQTAECNSRWCLLLAVPGMPTIVNIAGGKNATSIFQQQRPLRGLVRYFKDKQAAGVVTMQIPDKRANPDTTKDKVTSEVLYAFPPCEFAKEKLNSLAPNLNEEVIIDEYLVILILRTR